MPAPEIAPSRRRRPAYRQRLRSRIILSFLWLGFGLTALIAASTVYLRNRVENAVIASALIKNNDAFANGYYRNPDAIGIPFEKIQGRQFSTRKVDRVPIDELEGRVTTMLVTPYPPGIPLLIPGERFNKTIVQYLKFARDFNATFPGFETDIHGLVEQVKDGKPVYYIDCVK